MESESGDPNKTITKETIYIYISVQYVEENIPQRRIMLNQQGICFAYSIAIK